ncbi:MAG: hypothetical protein JWN16_2795 [Alphaproteobacteria bacterium]|nr:hypothetical protein [Alphaproteobacteria bacterium]
MRVFAGFIVVCLALPAPLHAEQTAIAMGYGVSTCAEFAQEYGRNVAVEDHYFNWTLGYWTGLNTSNNVNGRATKDLHATSQLEQKQRIREFCSEHPLEEYLSASTVLWVKLPDVPYKKP